MRWTAYSPATAIACPAAMKHAAAVAGSVQQLLTGSTEPDPGQHGLTTDEERAASRNLQVG